MSSTQLNVGGFTQPGVARGLIEMPANAGKGFSHRFLRFFPNPLFEDFSSLGEVDRDFVQKIRSAQPTFSLGENFNEYLIRENYKTLVWFLNFAVTSLYVVINN